MCALCFLVRLFAVEFFSRVIISSHNGLEEVREKEDEERAFPSSNFWYEMLLLEVLIGQIVSSKNVPNLFSICSPSGKNKQ
jgi:hypothetical protein